MRRDTLLAVGLLLAAIGELAWATTRYRSADTGDIPRALELFVAGAALLLASGGLFFNETRSWTLFTGLLFASLAHAAFLVSVASPSLGVWAIAAAGLGFVGLALAAWGVRSATVDPLLLRVGLALAALGAIGWLATDIQATRFPLAVGDVFAALGFVTCAVFAGQPEP